MLENGLSGGLRRCGRQKLKKIVFILYDTLTADDTERTSYDFLHSWVQ